MFNIGDFIIQGSTGWLLVAVTPTIGRVLCKRPRGLFLTQIKQTALFSTKDRAATQTDLTQFEKPQGWPKWVAEAKASLYNMPTKAGSIPAGAIPLTPQGLVDHKPRPAPKVDPDAGRPTLQMFQQTCAHKMVLYTGFSRVFKYCIFCDKKENI